jgi:hypothetical protein
MFPQYKVRSSYRGKMMLEPFKLRGFSIYSLIKSLILVKSEIESSKSVEIIIINKIVKLV